MRSLRVVAIVGLLLSPIGPVLAENTFLPNGGDLADSANWSNGAAPSTQDKAKIVVTGPTSFTLSSDISANEIAIEGNLSRIDFDLEGKSLGNIAVLTGPFSTGGHPTSIDASFRNGRVKSTDSGPFIPYGRPIQGSATLSLEDVDWKGDWVFSTPTTSSLSVKRGALGGNFSHEGKISNEALFDGTTITRSRLQLTADDFSATGHTVFSGGTKVSDNTDVLVAGRGSLLVTGEGTEIDLRRLSRYVESSWSDAWGDSFELAVTDGAKLSAGPSQPSTYFTPTSSNYYSGLFPSIKVDGDGSDLFLRNLPVAFNHLSITNGGRFVSSRAGNGICNVFGSITVDHGYFEGDTWVFFPSFPDPIIVDANHSTIVGYIQKVDGLKINQSTVIGDVAVKTITGNGRIEGSIRWPQNSGADSINVYLDGLLEITGDIPDNTRFHSMFDEVSENLVGQIQLSQKNNSRDIVIGSSPLGPSFLSEFDIDFGDSFKSSVGKTYVVYLAEDGSRFVNRAFVLPGNLSPEELAAVNEITERVFTRIKFLDPPPGYEFDIYIDEKEVGFRVVAVPEASNVILVGLALIGTAGIAWRRQRLSR